MIECILRRLSRPALVLPFLLAASLSLSACDSVSLLYDIEVVNNCGNQIDYNVYIDERFRGNASPGERLTVRDVEEGQHTLRAEANTQAGTNITQEIEVTGDGDAFGICD